jgi:N-acetylglutamate synthase-like GNAT family acetyltransferase
MMSVLIRQADVADFREVESLYREVANKTVGLIRQEDEISYEYVEEFLTLSLKEDVSLVAANESGEIHAYKTNVKAFSHVLNNLTIAVHPEYYSIGVGRAIFNELMHCIAYYS